MMLNIGLITDGVANQEYFGAIIKACDCEVKNFFLKDVIDHPDVTDKVDAWIVDTNIEHRQQEQSAQFFQWLADTSAAVIVTEGLDYETTPSEKVEACTRQLKIKLLRLAGELNASNAPLADRVWVLGASAGGPDAVRRFLKALPEGLNIAFVYAQHIDSFQHKVLADAINRETHYRCFIPKHGDKVELGTVIIVPTNHKIQLLPNGTVVIDKNQQWRGFYKPSIDQVAANVADVFGIHAGLIVFSGMGDDGALGARLMALNDGLVWSQTVASAQAPSMPECCIATGLVTFEGEPETLAHHMAKTVKHQQWLAQLPNQRIS